MQKNMKKNFLKGLCMSAGFALGMSGLFVANSVALAAGEKDANGYYIDDVTSPWGRISIINATEIDGVNYVDNVNIELQVFASDDMCDDTEIKYYISTNGIPNIDSITEWNDYNVGEIFEITLPNVNSINTLYLILKDKNGNISMVYDSSLSQTVTYDLNAQDATMGESMATIRMVGASYVVTNQTPKREGYFFLGWGLNPSDSTPSFRQGDIIPADVQIGTDTAATLYAVWSDDASKLPKLSDVISIGDYVNYPVYYDNVGTNNEGQFISKRTGWRVLSKDVDIDGNPAIGTVNLVSAGVPLGYYHLDNSEQSVRNLAINFLNIPFSSASNYAFRRTGFNPLKSLSEIFNNKFTATYDADTTVSYKNTYTDGTTVTYSGTKAKGTLKVRSMTKTDWDKVYDKTGNTVTNIMTLATDEKYQDLLAIPANTNYSEYWLASTYDANKLWNVYNQGGVYFNVISAIIGVRPVVSLKPEVVAEGTDVIGSWKIYLP